MLRSLAQRVRMRAANQQRTPLTFGGALDTAPVLRFCSIFAAAALFFVPASLVCFGRSPGAQPSSFSGPTFGFLATGDTELRPIFGMPGASHLGDSIPLPSSVTKLHIAPGSAYALVEQSAGPGIVKLSIPAVAADKLSVAPIPDAAATLDAFAFSENGQAVALYSQAANSIQVITGLPDAPQVSQKLATAALDGAVVQLAISDDGAVVLAGDSSAIYSLQTGSAPAAVMAATASALAFLPNSHDGLACDRLQNTVTLLNAVATNPEVIALSKTINDPAAISSSADGKTIFVASPSQPRVWTIDRSSGLTKFYPTVPGPSQFAPLAAKDTFLLSPPESEAYWVLSWKGALPVMSFIAGPRQVSSRGTN